MEQEAANSSKCKHKRLSDQTEIIRWFEEVSEDAPAVQQQTLRSILELNHGVEYLKKWFGDSVWNNTNMLMNENALESLYTSCVPLASHADLEPYILRISNGDTAPLLTQEPISNLSLSSGTTEGRQKLVPFTRHSSQTTLLMFNLAAAHRSRIYPIRGGGKILEFIYSSKQYRTRGGGVVGTATTHYYSSEEFKIKQQQTKSFTCSPKEVISSGDYKQSTYCHLLLGLYFSEEVEFVTSTFAYSIVQAFTSFEELWKELCQDIREGSVSSSKVNIIKVRKAVLNVIKLPNPDLASRIESVCEDLERVDWFSLISKLWPNAKYVYSIMTGSMLPYVTKLRHYAGELPLVSADYGSTESWIGVNVDPYLPPERVTFTVVPTLAYFEFIPVFRPKYSNDQDGKILANDDFVEGDPVPLSHVKIGQEYEVVLTTFTGLYRYRLGDVVEVTSFYKKTPKLNFICRRKLILTVNINKNTEKDLQIVVERGSQILTSNGRGELVDFTSHADVAKQPGHYVIYWEIKGDVEEKVLDECCTEMDTCFLDPGYVTSRRTRSIGPLELCIVERGTFDKILEYFIGNGAALSQFKTPRCTNNQVLLRILNACTVRRFHSTAYG